MFLGLYLLALGALAVHAPDVVWRPGAREFVVILGVLGAWRWTWGSIHLVRALIFRTSVFPAWRRAADALGAEGEAGHVFIVITSYRLRPEITARVYQAAIDEAIRYARPATIVAALVEPGDERLIKRVFGAMQPAANLRLMFVRRPGLGKRHGVACALRAVSRARPPEDAAVLLVDGDTMLTPGTLARCLPFLKAMPEVDGITTDEDCVAHGTALMQAWHSLRFAQRHQLMSSLALSKRLLAMTGRMSIFRASVATDPGFIEMIENDHFDHWRFGRFPLLTGEDKSTWFWLLRARRAMLYVPDVRVVTLEDPPAGSFFKASSALMLRWFGNMLRTNGRALALGPRHVGPFVWWCLVDQRVSMWTPLIGPLVAAFFVLAKSAAFIYAYLLWVGTTRLIQSLLLLTARPRISGLYPLLIYYGQVYGALVKTYILFHLDRQRWTRQNIALERRLPPWQARAQDLTSVYLHALALGALAAAIGFATQTLRLPPLASFAAMF